MGQRTVKRGRFSWLVVAGLLLAMLIASCGGSDSSGGSSDGDGDSKAANNIDEAALQATFKENGVTMVPPEKCGDPVKFIQDDPDGVLEGLPEEAQANFESYPYDVRATPWHEFKGKKPPWKIGYITFPIDNPWKVGLYEELKKDFAAAKEAGLVEGDLVTYIQPSGATATPEQQNAAMEQMVRSGVDGILIHPLNAIAQTPAFDAAGKAGVPVVMTSDIARDSKYAVNVFSQNNIPGFAGILRILTENGTIADGETINMLRVRGIEGVTAEQNHQDVGSATLIPCPGINEVGTIWGEWNPATIKSEIMQFLASNPGDVDLVWQNGSSQAGIVQAFEQAGKDVPPMPWGGSSGGDLAWWAENKDVYETEGAHFGGHMVAHTTFRILLRILAGNELKVRDIHLPAITMTSENIEEFATPGTDLNWVGDMRGDPSMWGGNDVLDMYFEKPGSPGDL